MDTSDNATKNLSLLIFVDLEEALAFAAEGKVKATIETLPLESVNDVFNRLKTGKVSGRVVLGIGEQVLEGRGEKSTAAA